MKVILLIIVGLGLLWPGLLDAKGPSKRVHAEGRYLRCPPITEARRTGRRKTTTQSGETTTLTRGGLVGGIRSDAHAPRRLQLWLRATGPCRYPRSILVPVASPTQQLQIGGFRRGLAQVSGSCRRRSGHYRSRQRWHGWEDSTNSAAVSSSLCNDFLLAADEMARAAETLARCASRMDPWQTCEVEAGDSVQSSIRYQVVARNAQGYYR